MFFLRSFVKKLYLAVMCFILAFRAIDNIDTFVISLPVFVYLEPIGSAKPKFSEDINSKGITREESKETTLVCPAQSFPLPSFRLV